MEKLLLEQTIDLLKDLQSELHDVLDGSVIIQLDIIIQRLEAEYSKGEINISCSEVLFLLGEFLKLLPFISDLMKRCVD